MPKFRVYFTRTYSVIEGFDRVIEADDATDALNIAAERLDGYDRDCPDDCSEVCGDGASDFTTGDVVLVSDDTPVDEED